MAIDFYIYTIGYLPFVIFNLALAVYCKIGTTQCDKGVIIFPLVAFVPILNFIVAGFFIVGRIKGEEFKC